MQPLVGSTAGALVEVGDARVVGSVSELVVLVVLLIVLALVKHNGHG